MVARGYTTALLVAEEMAQDLTGPQLDQCADLIEAAEYEVDRETGRSWIATSPVSGELHTVTSDYVYLEHRPVVAITSVMARLLSIGSTYRTLTAGTDYELIDATNGIMLIGAYAADIVINTTDAGLGGDLLSVSYTHSMVINPAVRKITTELVAYWMRNRVSGSSSVAGIKSFTLPDYAVTYTDAGSTGPLVPLDIQRRLRGLERVLFA
jgi:hypothetical protein